jgi:hypothetical protein
VDCGINGDRLDQPTCDGKSAMPGKRVQFDDETWNASDLLSKTDLKTALRQSEMRFFSHMQEVCPQLLPVVTDDPWQTMHGWLLLERRVASGPGRRAKSAGLARERIPVKGGELCPTAGASGRRRSRINRTRGSARKRPEAR